MRLRRNVVRAPQVPVIGIAAATAGIASAGIAALADGNTGVGATFIVMF